MPEHTSHIPGHIKVGPNHKNTVGVSRDAGVAGNVERIPIVTSPPIPDSRWPDRNSGSAHKNERSGGPGNI